MYPSALLEKVDLEQRLEKKLNDVHNFNNSINNIKELIADFKDKNHKSKKKDENYKTLNTILASVDSFVIIEAMSTSVTQSIGGIALIILPVPAGIWSALSMGNEELLKIIKNKYNKNERQYGKGQQTNKSFEELYRKS